MFFRHRQQLLSDRRMVTVTLPLAISLKMEMMLRDQMKGSQGMTFALPVTGDREKDTLLVQEAERGLNDLWEALLDLATANRTVHARDCEDCAEVLNEARTIRQQSVREVMTEELRDEGLVRPNFRWSGHGGDDLPPPPAGHPSKRKKT